jgi:hypothetical protein
MTKLLLAAAFIPLIAFAQANIEDPVTYSKNDTGFENCDIETGDAIPVGVSCYSEPYLTDGIECRPDGECEPVFNVPTQDVCLLKFQKNGEKSFTFLDKECSQIDPT